MTNRYFRGIILIINQITFVILPLINTIILLSTVVKCEYFGLFYFIYLDVDSSVTQKNSFRAVRVIDYYFHDYTTLYWTVLRFGGPGIGYKMIQRILNKDVIEEGNCLKSFIVNVQGEALSAAQIKYFNDRKAVV